MRLLQRLRQHIAQWHLKVLAVMLAGVLRHHRDDRLDRFLPDRALLVERHAERLEFGDTGALAGAEFDPAIADEVERRDALGTARRMRRRQLHDPVTQADLLGALAGRTEKYFGSRGVGIFLEEMVLDLPGIVVAEPVGEFDLVQRILVEPPFAALFPWARQLQLVEDAEFHRMPLLRAGQMMPAAVRHYNGSAQPG